MSLPAKPAIPPATPTMTVATTFRAVSDKKAIQLTFIRMLLAPPDNALVISSFI